MVARSSMADDDGDYEDTAVAEFLSILEEHRKNCERQGKYVEAEIAKNRLEELKLHEYNRRKEAMRSRQIAERLGVEEAHMLEFQQFNHIWDQKMAECVPGPQVSLAGCSHATPRRLTMRACTTATRRTRTG